MGLKISELLKWKTNVILLDSKGNPILDDKNKPVEVWLRVIGDDDLDESHRLARIASANLRKELRTEGSAQWKDRVEPIMDAPREDCIEVLKSYRTSNLYAEARVKTIREELPKIDEVAVEPDAPTLEETEKLDDLIFKQEERYQKAIDEYVEERTSVIVAELEEKTTEELRELTKEELSGVLALSTFYTELLSQKVFRGSYLDKACTKRAFDTYEEFIVTDSVIKDLLTETYTKLEFNPDDIKK